MLNLEWFSPQIALQLSCYFHWSCLRLASGLDHLTKNMEGHKMIGAALRSSGPLGNELASFWLSEAKLMEWAVSAVSTNDVALRPERLPSQGHKVGFSKCWSNAVRHFVVCQRHGSHPLIGEPWSFSPLRRSRLVIHNDSVGFWSLHVFVPGGRTCLEATLPTPMVPPRETSQMESSMAGVGGCTALRLATQMLSLKYSPRGRRKRLLIYSRNFEFAHIWMIFFACLLQAASCKALFLPPCQQRRQPRLLQRLLRHRRCGA